GHARCNAALPEGRGASPTGGRQMHRRSFIIGGLGFVAPFAFGATTPKISTAGVPFDGSMVRQLARERSQAPYKAPDATLPAELKDLDYDAYRAIRFLPEGALWREEELPFQVQFFHRGFLFNSR